MSDGDTNNNPWAVLGLLEPFEIDTKVAVVCMLYLARPHILFNLS